MLTNNNIVGPSISEGDIVEFAVDGKVLRFRLHQNLEPGKNKLSQRDVLTIPESEWESFDGHLNKTVLLNQSWYYSWKTPGIWIGLYRLKAYYFSYTDGTDYFKTKPAVSEWIVDKLKSRAESVAFDSSDLEAVFREMQIPLGAEDLELKTIDGGELVITQFGNRRKGAPDLLVYIPMSPSSYIRFDFTFTKHGNDHLPVYPLSDEEYLAFRRAVMMEILDSMMIGAEG